MTIPVQPGYLVVLKTKVRGGIERRREELDHHRDGAADVAAWKTTRRIEDLEEFEAASAVRSSARNLVRKACLHTPFGLICLKSRRPELDQALVTAHSMVDAHNAQAEHTRVKIACLMGEIAQSEAEAIEAVTGEIRDLLEDLKSATADGRVEDIRDVANRARVMQQMLDPESDASETMKRAIKASRTIARAVAKHVEAEGEDLATVLEAANMQPIAQAAFFFAADEEVAAKVAADDAPELPLVPPTFFDDDAVDTGTDTGEAAS
jgi:hypothetical protein